MFKKNLKFFFVIVLFFCIFFIYFLKEVTDAQQQHVNNENGEDFLMLKQDEIQPKETNNYNDLLKINEDSEENVEFLEENIKDPRLGECSVDELKQIRDYFKNESKDVCNAYGCIDEEYPIFFEKLSNKYNDLSVDELKALASRFSACYCRCPMIECEIDFARNNLSQKCNEATKNYCSNQNKQFVKLCTEVAEKFPEVYDINIDPAGFKSPCAICSEEKNDELNLSSNLQSSSSPVLKRQTALSPEIREGNLINKLKEKINDTEKVEERLIVENKDDIKEDRKTVDAEKIPEKRLFKEEDVEELKNPSESVVGEKKENEEVKETATEEEDKKNLLVDEPNQKDEKIEESPLSETSKPDSEKSKENNSSRSHSFFSVYICIFCFVVSFIYF